MADLFWLSDEPWAVIGPFMPVNQPGPERKDDRKIISGMLHVLISGCRWQDCPAEYGPRTTVYKSLQPVVSAWLLAGLAGRHGQGSVVGRSGSHRQHLRQSASLRPRR
ncbi:hypothetical protein OICFNHDK_1612 [Methylobacterium bullatum]|uniref:Insertion element IS402-like domain-containing protein n=1 Tax=Methylobacterium bullatum TaxID=570505 RepID=A0AAV4Z5C9_9HYPH|nr:hypothetical protein OICFNHDK_1612 [Methylobacterium bullatum]